MSDLRCVECDGAIVPTDRTCVVHEPDCDQDVWTDGWLCYCPSALAHRRCCKECQPLVIPGQVEAFPEASTQALPKRRSA